MKNLKEMKLLKKGKDCLKLTKLTYLGHSCIKLITKSGLIAYIDPWIIKNPLNNHAVLPEMADLILITHDHYDHVGDSVALSKKTGAKVVGQPETISRLISEGLPQEHTIKMNIGGTITIDDLSVTMVHAFHTSLTGLPAGYIIKTNGKVVYHLGDTGLFGDLKMFGELYKIDYALIPVGGVFTMDYKHGVIAAKMLRAKNVIPIHYKTFPVLLQDIDLLYGEMSRVAPEIECLKVHVDEEIDL